MSAMERTEGLTLGLFYEVGADVGDLAVKCHQHFFHALAFLFDLTLKELVEINPRSLACQIELESNRCLV